MSSDPPVLLVLADSLAYYGPRGGLPIDDPRIWPNLVAAELGWHVELIARIGWTSRDAYWALTQDPRAWAAVPKAGAVVFAVGGMDTLPSPLPTLPERRRGDWSVKASSDRGSGSARPPSPGS